MNVRQSLKIKSKDASSQITQLIHNFFWLHSALLATKPLLFSHFRTSSSQTAKRKKSLKCRSSTIALYLNPLSPQGCCSSQQQGWLRWGKGHTWAVGCSSQSLLWSCWNALYHNVCSPKGTSDLVYLLFRSEVIHFVQIFIYISKQANLKRSSYLDVLISRQVNISKSCEPRLWTFNLLWRWFVMHAHANTHLRETHLNGLDSTVFRWR